MPQVSVRSIFVLVVVGVFTCRQAHAYLDPSTITAVGQVLAGLCTWAVLGFIFFRNQFTKIFLKTRQFFQKGSSPVGSQEKDAAGS